jgi:hypothetical protein
VTKEELKLITPEQILPSFYRDALSGDALKLYVALWYRAAGRELQVQVISNMDASKRSRLNTKRLNAAQQELSDKGFVLIERLNFDWERYEFQPLPSEDAALWHLAMSSI